MFYLYFLKPWLEIYKIHPKQHWCSNKTQAAKQFAYIFIHLKSPVEKKESEKQTFSFPSANNFSQNSEYINNRKNSYNSMYKRETKMKPQSNRSFQ